MTTARVFGTHRRYLCAKALKLRLNNSESTADAFDGKRKLMSGTDLPAEFPQRAALIEAKYWALEDLQGVEVSELVSAGLSTSAAQAVVAAIVALG